MTIEQAINKTLQIFDDKTSHQELFWAIPILHELNELDSNLLIQWGGKCIQIYLSEFRHPNLKELEKYVQEALTSKDKYTSSECVEISRKIWYLKGRDDVQTSLSHLWAAKGYQKEGDTGIDLGNFVVTLLLPDISNRNLLNLYLEAAVKIHQGYQV